MIRLIISDLSEVLISGLYGIEVELQPILERLCQEAKELEFQRIVLETTSTWKDKMCCLIFRLEFTSFMMYNFI